jgi:hypothetical protein
MKRIAFLCLSLLALTFNVNAQDLPVINRVKVDFGPKIGVNLSKMDGKTWDAGYKTNLLGGLFLSVHGKRFGVQIEGLFSQTTYVTGQDFNSVYNGYIAAGKDSLKNGQFKISYFNIPVMAQLHALNRAWLQAGLQYSGVVSVEDKDAFLKDAKSLFDKGSVAAVFGLWIDVTGRINAGARYVMGLNNVQSSDLSNVSDNWKQRDVQLHVGLTF